MNNFTQKGNALTSSLIYIILFSSLMAWVYKDQIFADQLRPKYFDKAFNVGISKKSDIDAWKEQGGFQSDQIWKGYEASKVQYRHDSNETLIHVILRLSKIGKDYKGVKAATFSNIKQDFKSLCGSNWKKDSLEDVYRSADAKYHCKYEDSNGDEIFFEISTQPVF